ncbi:MAG: sigma-70 family RNA polymerase sigma factor [Tannerella sp.]|jgi:RNA polymerase sigma-70 factor (ECF subfamily)|nr:sigma-70 family RNA polymerase sigma factor [Tannerella sp.]
MRRQSDNYYVERIRSGETDCFAPLLERYGKQVFSLVVKIVENREDAEELAQDVFMKAFRSISAFRGDSSFSTWLYRIAYNMAVSATRKAGVMYVPVDDEMMERTADEPEDDFDGEADSPARLECLNCALNSLPPEDRAMITLFYREDRSMGEIAVITGLSETNVKTRIFRIRKKLFVLIKEMERKKNGTDG